VREHFKMLNIPKKAKKKKQKKKKNKKKIKLHIGYISCVQTYPPLPLQGLLPGGRGRGEGGDICTQAMDLLHARTSSLCCYRWIVLSAGSILIRDIL